MAFPAFSKVSIAISLAILPRVSRAIDAGWIKDWLAFHGRLSGRCCNVELVFISSV
jgi:hypothetical protein